MTVHRRSVESIRSATRSRASSRSAPIRVSASARAELAGRGLGVLPHHGVQRLRQREAGLQGRSRRAAARRAAASAKAARRRRDPHAGRSGACPASRPARRAATPSSGFPVTQRSARRRAPGPRRRRAGPTRRACARSRPGPAGRRAARSSPAPSSRAPRQRRRPHVHGARVVRCRDRLPRRVACDPCSQARWPAHGGERAEHRTHSDEQGGEARRPAAPVTSSPRPAHASRAPAGRKTCGGTGCRGRPAGRGIAAAGRSGAACRGTGRTRPPRPGSRTGRGPAA